MNDNQMIKSKIKASLPGGDALIIVPPFAGIDRPSLAAHLLQANVQAEESKVDVLYANIILASIIGEVLYTSICYAPTTGLIGERFFSKAAYGLDPIEGKVNYSESSQIRTSKNTLLTGHLKGYAKASYKVDEFVSMIAECIVEAGYQCVGATSSFEQTSSSIALLSKIKQLNPKITTLMGGANCEGAMAEGVISLNKNIDYVFSGESEQSFALFLKLLKQEKLPENKVVRGNKANLEQLETPDYQQYYQQLADFLPDSQLIKHAEIWLPFETSRGCWWGEKSHCTFCGINGDLMGFRKKSPEKSIMELKKLFKQHCSPNICMIDNIMPHNYFKDFLPMLANSGLEMNIFYEQKSNLKYWQVEKLKLASVNVIQPGIESLSTPLLKHMKKGVKARKNIDLLRSGKMLDVTINWNILHSFPGDQIAWYKSTLKILPLIEHLHPPTGVFALSIDRFSPYFEQGELYGLSKIRPMGAYLEVFPDYSDINKIAYHFEADYQSESRDNLDVIKEIENVVVKWRELWKEKIKPTLSVSPISDSTYLLFDSRSCANNTFQFISSEQAEVILNARNQQGGELKKWAIDNFYAIEVDGVYAPLAVTDRLSYKHFANHEFLNKNQQRETIAIFSDAG